MLAAEVHEAARREEVKGNPCKGEVDYVDVIFHSSFGVYVVDRVENAVNVDEKDGFHLLAQQRPARLATAMDTLERGSSLPRALASEDTAARRQEVSRRLS